MPDTSAARAAIREAYNKHRSVMGGMSHAMLKLEAAGGLIRDDPLPYAEDDPVWIRHALSGLKDALDACDELEAAVTAAFSETGKLLPGVQVTIGRPSRTEWGVRRRGEADPFASGAEGGVRKMAAAGGHLGAPLDVVCRQVTPWVLAPEKDGERA